MRNQSSQHGLALSEYLPLTAMIALATLAMIALFGDSIQQQFGNLAREIAGRNAVPVTISQPSHPATIRTQNTPQQNTVLRAAQGFVDGLETQFEGLAEVVLHPVESAKGIIALAHALITDPVATLSIIKDDIGADIDALTSGDPYEMARVIGENINPAVLLRIAGRLSRINRLPDFDHVRIKCNSFAVDTPVWFQSTQIPIQTLMTGKQVDSRNEVTFADQPRVITGTTHHTASGYYLLTTETDHNLKVTAEHPFWAQGKGWKEVASLDIGTAIATMSGDVLIRHIEFIRQPVEVYNLSIANTPSYFVGDDAIWVHNANRDCNPELDRTKLSIKDNRAKKIFGNREGHLPDTSENRQLLENIANDPKTTLGTDKHGNVWSAKTLDDGTQVWTQSRNEEIINGGLNLTPRVYNPETGLSSPTRPNWK